MRVGHAAIVHIRLPSGRGHSASTMSLAVAIPELSDDLQDILRVLSRHALTKCKRYQTLMLGLRLPSQGW